MVMPKLVQQRRQQLVRSRNGKVEGSLLQYGERKRPEHRSKGLLIEAQVAYAPRTVMLATPYFSNFFCRLT
jgi:hypothetical protein